MGCPSTRATSPGVTSLAVTPIRGQRLEQSRRFLKKYINSTPSTPKPQPLEWGSMKSITFRLPIPHT